jgi:peptide/nickel transport system permease protein
MQAVFGDPVVIMLGRDADPDTVARLRRDLGLDRPVHVQYADWLARIAHGDWGRSFRTGQPVLGAIAARLPVSLELAFLSLFVAVVLALALGILAAVRPRSAVDAGISVLTAFGTAMPNFWIAILLILLFALHLRVLPSSGSVPLLDDPWGHLRAMVLPTVTLSIAYLCNLARLVRAKMLEALATDYVRTARAKGLRESRVLWVHALRNSVLPVLSILAVSMSRLFGGAVVTETIFALPGVGILLVDSILGRDFPVVQGIIIVVTVGVFATNFLIEIAYAVVDPRVRYQ